MYRSNINILNIDCLEYMSKCKDNFFDLAIVDPPYGISRGGQEETFTKNPKHKRKFHKYKNWDSSTPNKKYFEELERISKNQIIFGANYFVEHLTKGTMGWIVWDKGQKGLTMSDCELIYTSFNRATRIFEFNCGFIAQKGGSIHPTQKPVELYRKILKNYANEKDKIFDSHSGSGSLAIACDDLKFDLTACELDEEYFNNSIKRLNIYRNQKTLF